MSALSNLYGANPDTEVPSYFLKSIGNALGKGIMKVTGLDKAVKKTVLPGVSNMLNHIKQAEISNIYNQNPHLKESDPFWKYRAYIDKNNNFIDMKGRNSSAFQGIQKGLAELYYKERMNELNRAGLPTGKPSEYIQSMEQAYDEYARKVPHVKYVIDHGKDRDGTSADWARTAKSAADIGMIDYGKFGRAHNRPLPRLVGYYDAAGNMIQPGETPAFQSVLNTRIEDSPYQEYYDPVAYPEMELNPIAARNMALRNEGFRRKAPKAQYVDDYVEWLKQSSQQPLMDQFEIGMNLSNLYGTDSDEAMRLAMTSFAADEYQKDAGKKYAKDLPQWRMPQNLIIPERADDVYRHNMSRLYRQNAPRQQRDFGMSNLRNYRNYGTYGMDPSSQVRGLLALASSSPDSIYALPMAQNLMSLFA